MNKCILPPFNPQPHPCQITLPPAASIIANSHSDDSDIHRFWIEWQPHLAQLLSELRKAQKMELHDATRNVILSGDPLGFPCQCYKRITIVYGLFAQHLASEVIPALTTKVARTTRESTSSAYDQSLHNNRKMDCFLRQARALQMGLPGSHSTDHRPCIYFPGPLADPTEVPYLLEGKLVLDVNGRERMLWSAVDYLSLGRVAAEEMRRPTGYSGAEVTAALGLQTLKVRNRR